MIPIRDTLPSRTTPYVVYGIIALNALVFFLEVRFGLLSGDQRAIMSMFNGYGLVPIRYSSPEISSHFSVVEQVIPFFSSIFMHGGIFHFVGNMWMLWIFGDNVEDWFGHKRFLLFYLVCGVAAGMAHMIFNWGSSVPTIGASGAIAGVMGAYMLLYPRARVLTLVPIFIFIHFVELPAVVFLAFWFALQLLNTAGSTGAATVAWWAHIGGFVVGMGAVVMLGGMKFLTNLPSSLRSSRARTSSGRGPRKRPPPPKKHGDKVDDFWK